jgi:Zn-dependent protease
LLRRFGAIIVVVLLKLKLILGLVLKGKVLGPLISAIISVGAYTLLWGWPFAALFVAQLFVHEMGHVIELRRQGVKATAPMFIPFLGAVIGMKEMPHDARREAQMAIAGPIAGGLAALVLALLGWHLHSDLLLAAATTGFLINLFNLIPLTPLDGGRIVAAVHPGLWAVGAVLMLAVFALTHSPILLIFAVIGGMDAWRRWRARKGGGKEADYYTVRPAVRLAIGAAYVALAVALAIGMDLTAIDVSQVARR